MAVPQLLACLDDYLGYDSWPARITFADLLQTPNTARRPSTPSCPR